MEVGVVEVVVVCIFIIHNLSPSSDQPAELAHLTNTNVMLGDPSSLLPEYTFEASMMPLTVLDRAWTLASYLMGFAGMYCTYSTALPL
jgi:hypothetical protein